MITRTLAAQLAVASALATVACGAAAQTWSGGGGDNLWSNGGNWVGGVPPASANTTVVTFDSSAATFTPDADGAWTLRVMNLSGPPGYSITGPQLTFDGVNPAINLLGASPHSIASVVILNANTLLAGNTPSVTFSGGVGGAGGLTKTHTGTITLTGLFGFSGLTTVSAGTLAFGDGFSGPAVAFDILNNALVEFNVPTGLLMQAPLTGSGIVRVTGGMVSTDVFSFAHAGETVVLAGGQLDGSVTNNARLTVDGVHNSAGTSVGSLVGTGVVMANAGTFTFGSDNTDAAFTGTTFGGSIPVVKVGTGRQTLANFLTYSGITTISGGTLVFGDGTSGPPVVFGVTNNAAIEFNVPTGIMMQAPMTGTGSVTVVGGLASSGAFSFSHGGTTTVNAGAQLDATIVGNNSRLTVDGQFNTGGTSVGSLVGTGQVMANSGSFTFGSDNTNAAFTGSTFGGNVPVVKVGTGRQTLAHVLTYSGTTTISGGTLAFGNGVTGTGALFAVVDNAALELNVPTGIVLQGPVTGTGTVTVVGGLASSGAFSFAHAGSTTVNAGAQLDATITNNALLTLNGVLNTGGATVGSLTGAGQLNVNSGTFATGGDNTSTTFSGGIAHFGSFVKAGTGRLTLSGAGTQAGTTTIGAGSIALTGTTTSPIVVASGATLLGTGTASGGITVNAGGTLAPGLSPGLLNSGNLVVAGILLEEIEGTVLGAQYDGVNVTGTVDITGATLTLAGAYVPVAGNTFTLITNDGVDPVVGTFAGLPEGASVMFQGRPLTISYVGGTGNDVVLAFAAAPGGVMGIPTLSQWMLMVLASLLLLAGCWNFTRARAQ